MTLTAALEGKDGIVCATDSRGTFGDPRNITAQNDTMKKLYPITKYSVIMVSGANQQGAMIMNEIQQITLQKHIEGVTGIMQELRGISRERYNEWFPSFPMVPHQGAAAPPRPGLIFTIAGYDLGGGKPAISRIYEILSTQDYAPNLFDFGFALSGIPQYATYLLNRLYTREMTVKQLLPLAAYIITETASQDGKVGGDLQMCTITESKGVEILDSERVKRILKSNEDKSNKLHELFISDNYEER
ncbi:MAG: hypothetical protein M1422_01440 [Candidatus Thermoplasmatota archaeon]|jgi:20S proteasome alpha/beta subunit|nr:hypothetical protein [Candidatus Sysuiplasma jiujiangense]MCL4316922.1 hypothetical protein [Candidatus Thermoplasmatota archaeon]